jgi:hypothetical protein
VHPRLLALLLLALAIGFIAYSLYGYHRKAEYCDLIGGEVRLVKQDDGRYRWACLPAR